MDKIIESVFKALNIKPCESFNIKGNESENVYHLDENLNGYSVGKNGSKPILLNANFLRDILRGELEIVKLPKEPTKEDKIIIDYARLCGFNWIAVDRDGDTYVSTAKPTRYSTVWGIDNPVGEEEEDNFDCPLSFLTWEDEPYYIGEEE